MNNMVQKLEALLFTGSSAISKKKLSEALHCTDTQLAQSLNELQEKRKDSGVILIDDGSQVILTTNPTLSTFMSDLQKEEQEAPLSKAMQETLSIIAYAGPISKVDLDFLRGVNTQYTLRRLSMRGLIRDSRERNAKVVSVTTDFMQHLGIRKPEELSDYQTIRKSIITGLQSVKKQSAEKEV